MKIYDIKKLKKLLKRAEDNGISQVRVSMSSDIHGSVTGHEELPWDDCLVLYAEED